MIRGSFGVGKSVLLRQKAIQLNKQSEDKGKVMFLVGTPNLREGMKPMLCNRLKFDLEENRGIFIEEMMKVRVFINFRKFRRSAKVILTL